MDGPTGTTSDSVVLILATLSFLGVTIPPIIVALIGRMGSRPPVEPPAAPPPDPLLWVPRAEWSELFDRLSRADDENDRLARTVERLGAELDRARDDRITLRIELARLTARPIALDLDPERPTTP